MYMLNHSIGPWPYVICSYTKDFLIFCQKIYLKKLHIKKNSKFPTYKCFQKKSIGPNQTLVRFPMFGLQHIQACMQ